MKYQVGDKFTKLDGGSIEILTTIIPIYVCDFKNKPTTSNINLYKESYLDSLCKNGWIYAPVNKAPVLGANSGWVPGTILGVPPINYSSNLLSILPFKNAFSDIDLTPNVLGSINKLECSHSLYEEKVLFTSWYKVCINCKKEFV